MTTGVRVRRYGAVAALVAFGICFAALPARAQDACAGASEFAGLERTPEHIRDRVARKLPLKIVAIGSSSTSGAGASSSAATYPSRLEAELKERLPGLPVTVLLDTEGREIGRLVGPAEWDSEDAKRLIRSALK